MALGEGVGLSAEVFNAFRCRGWTDVRLTAVRAGALLFAAGEDIVTALGLAGINHADRPFLVFSIAEEVSYKCPLLARKGKKCYTGSMMGKGENSK